MPTLADIYNSIKAVPGRVQNFAQNPVTGLKEMGIDAVNRAVAAKDQLYDATESEGMNYGPKSKALAGRMADAYNFGGMISKTLASKYPDVALSIAEKPTAIDLSKIVVPPEMRNQGVGSSVMKDLIQYADDQGKQINLSPSADFGGSPTRLKKFYKELGFQDNRGRGRDFSTTETMVRPAAERPVPMTVEEYRGSHKAPNAEVYGSHFHDLTGIMPADVYTVKGKNLYGLGDPAVDSEWWRAAMKAKGNPNADVEVFRAVPKGVKDINHGDWVTTSPTYANQHGENALNGEFEVLSKKVKANKLSSEGYPYEFGYHEK